MILFLHLISRDPPNNSVRELPLLLVFSKQDFKNRMRDIKLLSQTEGSNLLDPEVIDAVDSDPILLLGAQMLSGALRHIK